MGNDLVDGGNGHCNEPAAATNGHNCVDKIAVAITHGRFDVQQMIGHNPNGRQLGGWERSGHSLYLRVLLGSVRPNQRVVSAYILLDDLLRRMLRTKTIPMMIVL